MSVVFLPPRIARELDQILQHNLTIIEAGAGYGKTTFLMRWSEERQITCLWYTSGEDQYRDLPQGTRQKPLILVFDNWHKIANPENITELINRLLCSSPSYLHIVLCTRSTPTLGSLQKNGANEVLKPCLEPHKVYTLDENRLALTPEEISSFMARTFGVILSLGQIEWLRHETEGWMQAVSWAGEAIVDNARSWNPESIAGALRTKLFPYFEAEIMQTLPFAKQEFLLALALPDEISPQILAPLLDLKDYRENLEWSVQNHLFIVRTSASPSGPESTDAGAYLCRYHPLFKEFLRSQLVQHQELHQSLASRLGGLYLEQGQVQKALPYLIQASLYAEAAAFLNDLLPELTRSISLEAFERLAALFPPEADQYLHNTLLALGERLANTGRNTDALSWLRRAALGFGQLGDDLGLTRALCAMGTVYTALGLTEEAEAIYHQAQGEAEAMSYLTRYQQLAVGLHKTTGIPRLRLLCLGPFEIWRGEQRLPTDKWRRRKALSVLKYLALQPRYKAAKEQLLDLLWPGESPEKASNSYYVAIHSMRRGLTSGLSTEVNYLEVERGSVALVPDLIAAVDVDEFMSKYQEGVRLRPANPAQALPNFQTAQGLYRADLLCDDLYEEWLLPLREHLRTKYLDSLSYLASYAAAMNEAEQALALWHELLRHEPTNEPAAREAITLMCSLGRNTQALQYYRSFCRRLQDELATDPEPETQRLYTTLFRSIKNHK